MSEQNTLREQLAAGLEQIEQQQQEPVQVEEQQAEAPESPGHARDEKGRFAKADVPSDQKPEEQKPEAQQEESAPQVKRPSSWKKEMWEKYDSLPPEVRDYILQREGESAQSLHGFRQQAESAKQLQDAIAPFMPELQQYNIHPAQWIQNLGNAHRTLALGSPQEKLQMFAKLAQEYGVPLEYLAQGAQPSQVDPNTQWLTQQVQHLSQNWNHFQQQQQQQEQQQITSEISKFAETHEHFDAVRETMAGLLQSGLATDLQSAYDKAIRMNDEIWAQQQAAHAETAAQEKARQQAEAAAKAKAAAVSPRSSSPSGKAQTASATNDRRAQLAEAFDALGARV